MNGETSPIPQIVMGNPVLELLTGIINEVKAGRVTTVAVLAVAPQGGVATPYVGPQAGDLYVAAGLLQRRILQNIEAPPARSPLIRATVVG